MFKKLVTRGWLSFEQETIFFCREMQIKTKIICDYYITNRGEMTNYAKVDVRAPNSFGEVKA